MVGGGLMWLVAYGAHALDIHVDDRRYIQKRAYADNPYYRELANEGHRIHAAGGRHGGKRKDNTAKPTGKAPKREKHADPSREPVNMQVFDPIPNIQRRPKIPDEQLADEMAYRIKYEAMWKYKRELALDNLRLEELKAKTPINPLPEDRTTCCISYEPIPADSMYTQCQRCSVVCSRAIMDFWLKNNKSCPACRLDMSKLDIDTITFRCAP